MGASRLEMMSNRLQEERKTLESNVATVEKECAALDAKITASQQDENEADIDDAIQAPTPLHKQYRKLVSNLQFKICDLKILLICIRF